MPPPLRLHLLEGQAPSPCQHGRCSSRGPASRHHRASPATSSPPASDGVLVFSRMASIWPGDRAAGSVSWSSPTRTTGAARLSCQPKDCARRLAASLTCFPADVPFSSSQLCCAGPGQVVLPVIGHLRLVARAKTPALSTTRTHV